MRIYYGASDGVTCVADLSLASILQGLAMTPVTSTSPPSPPRFELGCNYWPRRSAMYMWRELDLGEVRADFAHMRDLGFRVVRLFLLTEDFLPAPMTVAKDKVAALVEVARIGARRADCPPYRR